MIRSPHHTSQGHRGTLRQIAEPESYRACVSDLLIDAQARSAWIALFRHQGAALLRTARSAGYGEDACRDAASELMRALDEVAAEPARHGRLDILLLDELRDGILRAHGIDDAYREVKEHENARAMRHLPERMARLRGISCERAAAEALMTGLLEGNLFDMGAMLTAAQYDPGHREAPREEEAAAGGGASSTVKAVTEPALLAVPPRPWRYDDVDVLADHLSRRPPRHTVIFTDNAGADVVLGVLPFADHLLGKGGRVTLAANERPSLNDVTASELAALCRDAQRVVPGLAQSQLAVRSTGSCAPLIDLAALDPEFVSWTADADFVVLLGMGRALESNWHVPFCVPVLRVAMVKDPQVAITIDAALLDAVCRFT